MDPQKSPSLLGEALIEAVKLAVREELAAAATPPEMLTPEELAEKLKMKLSWVYEQSRQGNIPTHRFGKYIRFDLAEVLRSRR